MKENETYQVFLDVWHDVMLYLFIGSIVLSVLVLLVYYLRYLAAGSAKAKYDLASEKEIKSLLWANYIFAFAIFCLVNQTYVEMVSLGLTWKLTRIFIGIFIATLHGYVAYLIFKYYYPGQLEKRLKRLRFTPRVNPTTGNTMKLLSEAEEDAYLDEGMIAEEDAFSVDYDVWIDPATGDTKIEKYKGHLHALECDRCGFQTLKLQKEEIIRQPTETHDGELLKEYKCSYCGRIQRKTVNLTNNVNKERDPKTGKPISDSSYADSGLDFIKIEINGTNGDVKKYQFQNLDQAKNFLEEFDFDKLPEESI